MFTLYLCAIFYGTNSSMLYNCSGWRKESMVSSLRNLLGIPELSPIIHLTAASVSQENVWTKLSNFVFRSDTFAGSQNSPTKTIWATGIPWPSSLLYASKSVRQWGQLESAMYDGWPEWIYRIQGPTSPDEVQPTQRNSFHCGSSLRQFSYFYSRHIQRVYIYGKQRTTYDITNEKHK